MLVTLVHVFVTPGAVAPMMAEPRKAVPMRSLLPSGG